MTIPVSTKVKSCFICGSSEIKQVFSLGGQPMSGIFPLLNENDPEIAPLALDRCESIADGDVCGNLQLSHIADFTNMYGMNYGYNSSLSPQMIEHLNAIAVNIKELVDISENDWLLDIGCNDGSLLKMFQRETRNLVGVDPSAGKFTDLISNEVTLFVDYFPSEACEKFMNGRKFKSITSIAMFYDLPRPREFIRAIYENLLDNGVWTVELAELNEFLKNLSYDQICHEHLLYLDNKQMIELAKSEGFYLAKITYSEINGGSACYYFSKDANKEISVESKRVSKSQINQMVRRIENNKKQVLDYLKSINIDGKKVFGYGASTKGNVLGNYYGLGKEELPFISDINPYKFGRKTPGTNIPIISHEQMRKMSPDFLLVFIWHLRKEVLKDEIEFIKNGGKIIFPLPRLHVVDIENYENYLNANLNDEAFDISDRNLTN